MSDFPTSPYELERRSLLAKFPLDNFRQCAFDAVLRTLPFAAALQIVFDADVERIA